MRAAVTNNLPRIAALLALAVVASFSLAAYSFYRGHRDRCASQNATADLFRDVITIATTPDPGAERPSRTDAENGRLDRILARIDLIRC